MTTATLGRWGNSLAVRIPGTAAAAIRLSDGDQVEIEASSDAIIIRAANPKFTAEAMFAGRSPADWRQAYAGAYDWGPDVGRENLPE